MNVLGRAFVAMIIAAGLALSAGLLTPANAWGDRTRCPGPPVFHTNRYDPFAGHHMDVFTGMCLTAGSRTVPPHLIWVRRPTVSFPTRNIFAGPIEDLEVVVAPYVTSVTRSYGVPVAVTYRFSVKQSIVKVGGQTFDFKVRVTMLSSRICFVGGACDTYKRW